MNCVCGVVEFFTSSCSMKTYDSPTQPKEFFFNIDLLQNYNLWLSKGDLAIRGCICGFLHACHIYSHIYIR